MSDGAPLLLILEDSPDDTYLLRRIARAVGWRTVEVSTLKEAREVLASMRVDLVLTDLHIPGTDGPQHVESALLEAGGTRVVTVSSSRESSPHAVKGDESSLAAILASAYTRVNETNEIHGIKSQVDDIRGQVGRNTEAIAQARGDLQVVVGDIGGLRRDVRESHDEVVTAIQTFRKDLGVKPPPNNNKEKMVQWFTATFDGLTIKLLVFGLLAWLGLWSKLPDPTTLAVEVFGASRGVQSAPP